MQNSFKQINEIIDNLLVICNEGCQLPKIEKDILLEKLRKLYLQSQMIEELEIPAKIEEEEPEYEVHKGMEDDVDLFFDTDHESYGAPKTSMAEELIVKPAPKLETVPEPMPKPVKESIPEPVKMPVSEPVAKIVVEPTPVQKPAPQAELKLELKSEPEVIKPRTPAPQPSQVAQKPEQVIGPEQLSHNDEDDLLQFIPQKSTTKPQPAPEKPTQPVQPQEKPLQTTTPRSLNDLFNKQQEDRSLGSQFQHAKVGDLTKAISINDKFTYIKELFNNKGEEFSAAIQKLNQCANMDEAFDCLEGLKKKYFWDSTATAYLSLCDLLRRKYN